MNKPKVGKRVNRKKLAQRIAADRKATEDFCKAYDKHRATCPPLIVGPNAAQRMIDLGMVTEEQIDRTTYEQHRKHAKKPDMVIDGRYNWKNQPERLIYIGYNWSGNGFWHQFVLVGNPNEVWCEIKDDQLHMIEEIKPSPEIAE